MKKSDCSLHGWGPDFRKNLSSLIVHTTHFCKIKAQFENIVLSLCRATVSYRVVYCIQLHMQP